MSNLSENIRNFRIFRNMTQRDLSIKLNKSVNTISNWERGNVNFNVELLTELCEALDTTPNQLMGYDKCPELEKFLQDEQEKKIAEVQDALDDLAVRMKAYNDYLKNLDNKPKK